MKHGTGLIYHTDFRDYEIDHLLKSGLFDWEKGYDIEEKLGFALPTKNQGPSESCTGQASATYAYVLNAIELKPIYYEATPHILQEMSAKSIYSQIALFSGGAYLGDALRSIVNYGINLEKMVPSYENGKPPSESFMQDESWITPELRERAGNYRGKEYRFVRELSMNTVAKTIVEGYGCLLAFSLDESYGTTKFPLPPRIHSYGHLVYAGKLKLINGEPYVGVKNSWGPHVGENGWQWLSKDFFQGAVKQCGVVIDKPNSLWVSFLDNKGKPRKFPTSFVKSLNYMTGRGSKLLSYD